MNVNAFKQDTHAPKWHSSHMPQFFILHPHHFTVICLALRKLQFATVDEITCQTTKDKKYM